MPQVLKPEIRARITSAGLQVFAEQGYLGATMSAIAERAGLAAASLYRYFPSKAELFEAAIPPEIATRFERLIEQRVSALAELPQRGQFVPEQEYGAEMLEFWLAHRLEVVVLLDRAQGSVYERYGERFVALLLDSTLAHIRSGGAHVRITAPTRLVLTRIFENTRSTLASILAHSENPRLIREAIEAFWSYQIPGLQGFARWVQRP